MDTDPRLGIVIPLLNEEASLLSRFPVLARELAGRDVVFVDGGSTDRGPAVAAKYGRVIQAPRGRGAQLNAGARAVQGAFLLFLHADCRIDRGALRAVERIMNRSAAVGGCLRQTINDPSPVFRALETGANVRSAFLKVPYGDQAMFVRRDIFERLGGFPADHPVMEDLAFALRLRRCGRTVALPHRVYCSSRRWRRHGILRATVRNWWLAAAYLSGVHPRRLARYFDRP